jgi:hypothetical protein
MSIVLAPPLDELLLLLLLQPAAARAIAATAAIAGIRLIYLPLVDSSCPAAARRTDRPSVRFIAVGNRELNGFGRVLCSGRTAPGPAQPRTRTARRRRPRSAPLGNLRGRTGRLGAMNHSHMPRSRPCSAEPAMVTPQESGVLSPWGLSRSWSGSRSCREDTSAYSTDTTELIGVDVRDRRCRRQSFRGKPFRSSRPSTRGACQAPVSGH